MLLSVGERLVLLSVLPEKGNFTTLKLIRELQENLSFTEEEHKLYNFQPTAEQNQVRWENDSEKEIAIGEKQMAIIKDSLGKLNDKGELRQEHFSLYEKFIGG